MVPSGAENGAVRPAPKRYESASICTEADEDEFEEGPAARRRKLATRGDLCANLHQSASPRIKTTHAKSQVRPAGFEPATLGSEGSKLSLEQRRDNWLQTTRQT
jgi:hypothetical protein